MKASELIVAIQSMIDQHGDKYICYIDNEYGETDIDIVIIDEFNTDQFIIQ